MQIQLKQTEIVEALKQYISRQGLCLVNKTTEVSFTAGRSGAGLIADIAIEDSDIPPLQGDLDLDAKQEAPLTLKVIGGSAAPVEAATATTPVEKEAAPAQEQAQEAGGEPAPAPAKASLFG